MDSKEYIKEKIDELVVKFPYIKIRYESNPIDHCHLIDVMPLSLYENLDYQESEDAITLDFIKKYPTENVVFISEKSETKLTKVDYETFGRMFYVDLVTMLHRQVIECYNLSYNNAAETPDIFKAYQPNFLELSSNVSINSLPAMHPHLSGINYHSSQYAIVGFNGMINVITTPAGIKIKETKKDDLTSLAA